MPSLLGRTQTVSEGFIPSGSPIGWWAADAIEGLSDGDDVTTWPDQSGNGNDFVFAAGKRPPYKVNIQNGEPIVRFEGSDVGLTGNIDLTGTDKVSIFLVYKSSVALEKVFLEFSEQYYSYTDSFYFANLASQKMKCTLKGNVGFSSWTIAAVATSFLILTTIMDKAQASGSEVLMYVNGSANGATSGSSENVGNFGNRILHVGARGAGAAYGFSGDIAEIIMYAGSEGRTANEAGLNTKYAIY